MDDPKPLRANGQNVPRIRAGDGRGRILDAVQQLQAISERHAIRLSNIEGSLDQLHVSQARLAAKVSLWSGLLAMIGALLARLLG